MSDDSTTKVKNAIAGLTRILATKKMTPADRKSAISTRADLIKDLEKREDRQ